MPDVSLAEYMIMLAYEANDNLSVTNVAVLIRLSDRTVSRMRDRLCFLGYLKREGHRFFVTEKAYNEKR